MKKFKSNFIIKIAAAVLSVLLLLGTAFFSVCAIVAGMAGAYTGEFARVKEDVMGGVLGQYAYEIADAYLQGTDIDSLYGEGNFYYSIESAVINKTTLPKDALVLCEVSVTKTRFKYEDGSYYIGYGHYDVPDRYHDYSTDEMYDDTFEYEATTVVVEHPSEPLQPIRYIADEVATVTLYERGEKRTTDLISITRFWLETIYDMRVTSIVLAIVCFVLFIFVLIFMFCGAGYRKGSEEASLGYLDKLPFDLFSAICLAAVFGIAVLVLCAVEGLYYSHFYTISEKIVAMAGGGIIAVAGGVAVYFITLTLLLSIATRIKVGGLLKNTLIYKVISLILRSIYWFASSLPLVWKTALLLLGVSIIQFFAITLTWYESDNLLLLWALGKFIEIPFFIWIALMLRKLKKGGEAIANGNVSSKIDTKYMPLDFGSFGRTLNNIGGGLESAVEEKLKSERLKTELITNVSHDIKTPLTSIVNYVDLMKKEKIDNEKVSEYIDVLDRHAARLKKLIEDLVEASKASTGNISVELEKCDIGVLLEQSLGEYGERLSSANITPIVTQPDTDTFVMADGRRLWRVFDNLLSNICKYAMHGTRAYITLEKSSEEVIITFKNISHAELNVSAAELTERFVRGDSSRNTDGSGLGLSIARSLTELQDGRLDIFVDGDLFKVVLTFPIA